MPILGTIITEGCEGSYNNKCLFEGIVLNANNAKEINNGYKFYADKLVDLCL